jgi:hypothetical protein
MDISRTLLDLGLDSVRGTVSLKTGMLALQKVVSEDRFIITQEPD